MKGFVQVYTGNGKGKTTAALGLALRAAGAGKKVFIAQFLKGSPSSELKSIARLAPEIILEQYGRKKFILSAPDSRDIARARQGLEKVKNAITSRKYDLLILDEINLAVHLKLISLEDLLAIMDIKPDNLELVLTGRYAHPRLLARADLVTEMKEIKHYYTRGVSARKGIEK